MHNGPIGARVEEAEGIEQRRQRARSQQPDERLAVQRRHPVGSKRASRSHTGSVSGGSRCVRRGRFQKVCLGFRGATRRSAVPAVPTVGIDGSGRDEASGGGSACCGGRVAPECRLERRGKMVEQQGEEAGKGDRAVRLEGVKQTLVRRRGQVGAAEAVEEEIEIGCGEAPPATEHAGGSVDRVSCRPRWRLSQIGRWHRRLDHSGSRQR